MTPRGFMRKQFPVYQTWHPLFQRIEGENMLVILAFLNEFYINYCLHSVLVFLVFICWFQNKTPKESYLMIVK